MIGTSQPYLLGEDAYEKKSLEIFFGNISSFHSSGPTDGPRQS